MSAPITSDALFRSAAGMAAATNYAQWTFGLFAPYIRGRVLEVGCGVGTFSRLIAGAASGPVTSIDVSEDAVAYCRSTIANPSIEFIHADIGTVEGQFDFIVCMNVLEHIRDDRDALRHMIGLLAPGGTLFLLVPAHQLLYSDFDREAGHYRRYGKSGLAQLVEQAGGGQSVTRRLFYFNSIGALGYFAVYKLLRKPGRGDASGEIGFFDRMIVPWQRRLERYGSPFGLSLVAVINKSAGTT